MQKDIVKHLIISPLRDIAGETFDNFNAQRYCERFASFVASIFKQL